VSQRETEKEVIVGLCHLDTEKKRGGRRRKLDGEKRGEKQK